MSLEALLEAAKILQDQDNGRNIFVIIVPDETDHAYFYYEKQGTWVTETSKSEDCI